MIDYRITFIGTKGRRELLIESPLDMLDPDNNCDDCEDIANELIDMGIELGCITFGENFRREIDSYGISIEPVEN